MISSACSSCHPLAPAHGAPAFRLIAENRWEADERPDPCSLGLLPSGSDPVGEWLVHRQPPVSISVQRAEKASRRAAALLAFLRKNRVELANGFRHSEELVA